jgi:hypothetical protein
VVARQVTIDRTRQVVSGSLLEMTGPWHCGIRFVLRRVQSLARWRTAVRDLCVWSVERRVWSLGDRWRMVTVRGSSGPVESRGTRGRPRVTGHSAALKALCLVLVISDNAQVLIMCLRLYVAKDD